MNSLIKSFQAGMWQSKAFNWTVTPEWTDWINDFKTYIGVTGPNAKATLEVFNDTALAVLTGNNKWAGGVLGPDGKIYGDPLPG